MFCGNENVKFRYFGCVTHSWNYWFENALMNEFKLFLSSNLLIRIDRINRTIRRIHLKVEMINQNHFYFHRNNTIACVSNFFLSPFLLCYNQRIDQSKINRSRHNFFFKNHSQCAIRNVFYHQHSINAMRDAWCVRSFFFFFLLNVYLPIQVKNPLMDYISRDLQKGNKMSN